MRLGNAELLRFIGYGQFNYEGYICRTDDIEEVHTSFVEYIRTNSKKFVIDFFDINSSSRLFSCLNESSIPKTSIQLYGCPLVNFNEPEFDDFFKAAFHESKKRAELKKFQRKLETVGDVSIVNLYGEDAYESYGKYIPELYEIFSKRFKGVYATSFFSSPSFRQFYDELIENLVKNEKGFISILLLDEIPIAFIFCLANEDTLIDWIPAFDPAFSKYNLGTLQYKMLFEKLYEEQKFKYFDFSKGSTVYKRKWSKDETFNWQFIINFAHKSLCASILYVTYMMFFRLKTWSRNKGWNSKIKHIIGSFNPQKNDLKEVAIKFVSGSESENFQDCLPYRDWASLSVSERTIILEEIYNGSILLQIKNNEGINTAVMKK